MRSIYRYIISPKKDRYENTIDVSGKELVINSDIYNHQFVSRTAIVEAIPTGYKTPVKVGDEVIVHHNIFRRWHDVRGNERDSASRISEDRYFCSHDQIFMYRRKGGAWTGFDESCFVSPVKDEDALSLDVEMKQVGILEIGNQYLKDMGIEEGDVVGFTKGSEYEFVVEGKRMYRMKAKDICVKYKDKNVEKYVPSWVVSMS